MRIVGVVMSVTLAGSVLLAVPAAAAPDYHLNASGIQQTVLRAQPPRTFGSWHQNIYFSASADTPFVCWKANGKAYELPKAQTGGGVGYQLADGAFASVTLFQYKDQASADAALAKLKKADCPDSAKVSTDVQTVVKAEQGSDFTDASMSGISSGVSYMYDGGSGMTNVMTLTTTTQRGLAVVQTDVTLSGPTVTTKNASKAGSLNTRWHKRVLAAYEAFGSGNSR